MTPDQIRATLARHMAAERAMEIVMRNIEGGNRAAMAGERCQCPACRGQKN